jgi:hypothetical protein
MGNTPSGPPTTLDFSKAQPVSAPAVTLDFSKAQPLDSEAGPTGVSGVLSGIGGGVIGTAAGAEKLLNKALPSSMQIPEIPPEYYQQRTGAEKAGGFMEGIGEFVLGDEALKGLDVAGRLGLAQKVAHIAQSSPKVARALELGMNAMRASAVGGGQGATQAAAEGKPIAQGAEGGAIGGALGSVAGEGIIEPGIKAAGEQLEKFAPKLGNALLGANKVKNFQYGKNPGRVFIDEDIPANPPWQSYEDVAKSLKKAGDVIAVEAHGVLSQSPNANVRISIAPQIDQIFDDALQDVSKRSGLGDRKGLIDDLEDLREEMTQNFDAKGNSVGTKGPMTAAEITKMKTSIGRGTKWDPNKSPEAQQILNNARKKVYAYLDSEVDKAVPEMKGINERWANQIEAEQLIKKRVAQEQAAAYGHSKAVSRSVIGAGVALIAHGDPIAGGALILNEAARTPAARIALSKGSSAAGKALQKAPTGAARPLAAAAGAKAGEDQEE